jgi:hypothetical protein
MPKQKTRPQPTINETDAPDATSAQRGREGRDENVIASFDRTEHGYTVTVVSARAESGAAKHGLMTMREAADFLMEDEGAIEEILVAAAVPLVHEEGQTYVARRDLRVYRDRDTAARREHLRTLTRRSIAAGLDDVDYSRLSDQP